MPSDSPPDVLERRPFDEALDLPPGPERDAWLAGACRGGETLRQRLLALLRVQDQDALALYKRFGFRPRTILLQQRHDHVA